jgi:hypothetical protein
VLYKVLVEKCSRESLHVNGVTDKRKVVAEMKMLKELFSIRVLPICFVWAAYFYDIVSLCVMKKQYRPNKIFNPEWAINKNSK